MTLIKDSVVDSSVHIVFNDDDIPFEEELLRNPHSLKSWLRYIEARSDAPKQRLNLLYERALKELPGSYKIWHKYLFLRRQQVRGRAITDPAYEEVNNCYERGLVFMHKMPPVLVVRVNVKCFDKGIKKLLSAISGMKMKLKYCMLPLQCVI